MKIFYKIFAKGKQFNTKNYIDKIAHEIDNNMNILTI